MHAKRFDHSDQTVFVLMGDDESAEGSVWETAQWAALHNLNNLCAIIDINRLRQSQPTMLQWELAIYKARWEAFGWQVLLIDGHSIPDLITAFESATQVTDRPTIVLAQTLKGKGLIGIEGLEGWHGKVLDKPTAAKVIAELESNSRAPARNGNRIFLQRGVTVPKPLRPSQVQAGSRPMQSEAKKLPREMALPTAWPRWQTRILGL
ncbi:MAG: hypothetical protein ACRD4C_04695 [Candidatus Acidiferrales bacterium]